MKRFLTQLHKGEKGLTLLELAVVAAILSIFAAMTAAGVSGQSTGSRGAAKTNDTAEVQKVVDNYQGNHPNSEFPVSGGTLPNPGSFKGIIFSSTFRTTDTPAVTKVVVPDLMARNPKHATDCANADGNRVTTVVISPPVLDSTTGLVTTPATNPDTACATAVVGSVPTWQLDSNGTVVNNLNDSAY